MGACLDQCTRQDAASNSQVFIDNNEPPKAPLAKSKLLIKVPQIFLA